MYKIMKMIIENGNYNKEDTIKKLDIFLAKNKITLDEYAELTKMIK